MIPRSITTDHLEEAVRRIALEGVPRHRRSRSYCLIAGLAPKFHGPRERAHLPSGDTVQDGSADAPGHRAGGRNFGAKDVHLPPKLVISVAREVATGEALAWNTFHGGKQSNRFLAERGFEVIRCRCRGNVGERPTALVPPRRTKTDRPARLASTAPSRPRVSVPVAPSARLRATRRFYDLLDRLACRTGGPRRLNQCDGRLDWPTRGIYFFFEPGEERSGSGQGPRVVRVGTHALASGAASTLWGRLRTHRGARVPLGGRHRSSIFRGLVGEALALRDGVAPPASWRRPGISKAVGKARLGDPEVKRAEEALESRVSETIGAMPFLWLGVTDEPGPESDRGWIERNAIALLSSHRTSAPDPPSDGWLGLKSSRPKVRRSGLWNQNHVNETCDASFLETMEHWIGRVSSPSLPDGSPVPVGSHTCRLRARPRRNAMRSSDRDGRPRGSGSAMGQALIRPGKAIGPAKHFVGRREELAAFAGMRAAASAHAMPQLAVLQAPSGAGKTALLFETARRAVSEGFVVLEIPSAALAHAGILRDRLVRQLSRRDRWKDLLPSFEFGLPGATGSASVAPPAVPPVVLLLRGLESLSRRCGPGEGRAAGIVLLLDEAQRLVRRDEAAVDLLLDALRGQPGLRTHAILSGLPDTLDALDSPDLARADRVLGLGPLDRAESVWLLRLWLDDNGFLSETAGELDRIAEHAQDWPEHLMHHIGPMLEGAAVNGGVADADVAATANAAAEPAMRTYYEQRLGVLRYRPAAEDDALLVLAHVAAGLPDGLSLTLVQRLIELAGAAPDLSLRLAHAGVLVETGGRWRFVLPALRSHILDTRGPLPTELETAVAGILGNRSPRD